MEKVTPSIKTSNEGLFSFEMFSRRTILNSLTISFSFFEIDVVPDNFIQILSTGTLFYKNVLQ